MMGRSRCLPSRIRPMLSRSSANALSVVMPSPFSSAGARCSRTFLFQRPDLALGAPHGDAPGVHGERGGQQVRSGEHRFPFGQVRRGPFDGFAFPPAVRLLRRLRYRRFAIRSPFGVRRVQRGNVRLRQNLRVRHAHPVRLPRTLDDLAGIESHRGGLCLPVPAQRVLVHVALVRAGHERGALGHFRVLVRIAQAALGHRGLDLRAARGERLDDLPRYARDLEPPVRVTLLDPVAHPIQHRGQFGAVDHADELLAAVQRLVGHGSPLAVLAPDHVGEHGVGVKLRVEVARGVVAERRRHRLLALLPHHLPRGGVADPGFGGVSFHPVKRAFHRPVVRGDDALVPADEGDERYGLRRGESEIAAGTVGDAPVPAAACRAAGRAAPVLPVPP